MIDNESNKNDIIKQNIFNFTHKPFYKYNE